MENTPTSTLPYGESCVREVYEYMCIKITKWGHMILSVRFAL